MRMVPSTTPQRPLPPENLPPVPERINHHLHENSLDPAGTPSECFAEVLVCSALLQSDILRQLLAEWGKANAPLHDFIKVQVFSANDLEFCSNRASGYLDSIVGMSIETPQAFARYRPGMNNLGVL